MLTSSTPPKTARCQPLTTLKQKMETKKEVIQYLFEEIERLLPLKTVCIKKRRGDIVFTVENNCKIVFSLESVMGGIKGAKSFVISFSMAIYNPFFAKILNGSFGKKDDNPLTKDLVLALYYINNLPEEWNVYERYLFCDNEDRHETAKRLLIDIENYFIPYCIPFVRDYEKLLGNYSNPKFVKQLGNWAQFTTGVVCAILTHQESKIEEIIVPLAKSNTHRSDFLEFKKSSDYNKELILPIKEYIYNNIFKRLGS